MPSDAFMMAGPKRLSLMNNVHENQPVTFETRWAMSYLRGPLTRSQLQTITDQDPNFDASLTAEATSDARPGTRKKRASLTPQVNQQQLVPSSVDQFFVECNKRIGDGERLVYRPTLICEGRVHYVRATYKIDK